MRVEALVRRPPVKIGSGTTVKQASEIFAREKIGLLVVASSTDTSRAESVISERDIVRSIAASLPLTTTVDEIATKTLVTVKRSDRLSKAVKLMLDNNIRHLIVQNDDGTLFGVLSVRDFLRERKTLEELTKEADSNATD